MELKDMILQTLDEFNQEGILENNQIGIAPIEFQGSNNNVQQINKEKKIEIYIDSRFLELLREKTLVLFEGLQSSQTKDISSKLDLVINYLEYQLSLIEETLQKQ